jgi:MFS family permease
MKIPDFLHENARWLAGGFLCTLFSSYGQTFYIALSSGEIRDELGLSHGDFGWIYMLATLTIAVLIPYIGRQIDHVRMERYAVFVVAGLAVSMLTIAAAPNVIILFMALAGVRMFGQGLMSHTAMTAVGRWFSANRGKAVSTAALGHQFGESVMPISFVAIAALVGWRGSWVINAVFLAVAILPLVYFLIRVPRIPHASETEREVAGRSWTRGEVLRDPLFWLLLTGILAPPVLGTTVFFHQVYLTGLRGWALGQFAGATPVLSIFAIGATFATGFLIDRFKSAVLLPVMLVFLAAANLSLGLVDHASVILVYMACMGVTFGMYASVFGAIWPELYGTAHLGAVKAAVTAMMVFGTALGPGISGWLIDTGLAFPDMIIAMGVYAILVSLLMAGLARAVTARTVRA